MVREGGSLGRPLVQEYPSAPRTTGTARMTTRYALDITRLIARGRRPAATGIDRVLLEYATFFRRRFRDRLDFVATLGDQLLTIPPPLADSLLDSVHRRWTGACIASAGKQRSDGTGHGVTARATAHRRILNRLGARALGTRGFRHAALALGGRPYRNAGGSIYINVSHKRLDVVAALKRRGPSRLRGVVMLHDLHPLTHPRFFPASLNREFEQGVRSVARSADLIICNSDQTADDLHRWIAKEGLRSPRTAVLPLGGRSPGPATVGQCCDKPYFVCLGSLDDRKNVAFTVAVWEQIIRAGNGAAIPELHLVGAPDARSRWLTRIAESPAAAHIHLVHGLNDQGVDELLRGSRALLFPSLAEGFGLPVLEALSLGVPVICSDLPALRQSGAGVPKYLKTDAVDDWAAAVQTYMPGSSRARAEQLSRLLEADLPSWSKHFDGLMGYFAELDATAS